MAQETVPTLPVSAITTALADVAAKDFTDWLFKVLDQIRDGDTSEMVSLPALEKVLYASEHMRYFLDAATPEQMRYRHQIAVTLVLMGWRLAEVKLQQDALAAMESSAT